MASTKPRVGIYLEDEIHKVLQALAQHERRSISNMAEALIIEAMRHRGLIKTPELPEIQLSQSQTEALSPKNDD